jgi:hypothetical protein
MNSQNGKQYTPSEKYIIKSIKFYIDNELVSELKNKNTSFGKRKLSDIKYLQSLI